MTRDCLRRACQLLTLRAIILSLQVQTVAATSSDYPRQLADRHALTLDSQRGCIGHAGASAIGNDSAEASVEHQKQLRRRQFLLPLKEAAVPMVRRCAWYVCFALDQRRAKYNAWTGTPSGVRPWSRHALLQR